MSSDDLELGWSGAAVGVAAVLLSVVGLQLGVLATELFADRNVPASALTCLGATGLAGALGFWLGSDRGIGLGRR